MCVSPLTSPTSFIPILLVMLGSYTVASSCLAVYSVAVDTLFLCFLKVGLYLYKKKKKSKKNVVATIVY